MPYTYTTTKPLYGTLLLAKCGLYLFEKSYKSVKVTRHPPPPHYYIDDNALHKQALSKSLLVITTDRQPGGQKGTLDE